MGCDPRAKDSPSVIVQSACDTPVYNHIACLTTFLCGPVERLSQPWRALHLTRLCEEHIPVV